ncbi:MAG: archaetidylserine decarboxylase [Chromatiales bacterium]|nr:archaetidylserine decarboxylase [Chromatiales bacterium]
MKKLTLIAILLVVGISATLAVTANVQRDRKITMLTDAIKAYPQYLMPGHLISRLTHKMMRIETPWFKNGMIRTLSAMFDIDMSDAQRKTPEEFISFNDFFTRALKPESRPIDAAKNSIVSPVDGAISQMTKIDQGSLIQAKGYNYTVTDLLGGDEKEAAKYTHGSFTTIYLSPRDYHRIHIPVSGILTEMVHVPGRLFSVNPATTRTIPRLFARNERVIAHFDTAMGSLAVVMVGAINVGSIETVWAGEVTPPAGKQIGRWSYEGSSAQRFDKGAEIGRFNMGSTVILLFSNPDVQWLDGLGETTKLKMGQKIGELN